MSGGAMAGYDRVMQEGVRARGKARAASVTDGAYARSEGGDAASQVAVAYRLAGMDAYDKVALVAYLLDREVVECGDRFAQCPELDEAIVGLLASRIR